MAACDGMSGEVELCPKCRLVDARVSGLVAAVNAERIAGFPGGNLFMDSVEQALAAALVGRCAIRRPPIRRYKGGLAPARLHQMAQCVGLSTAHFSKMFRKSTGESPRQFLLRQRFSVRRRCCAWARRECWMSP
jgi:AraC family transcriptional regulator